MKYLIETWGCQMNSHDSEKLEGLLLNNGYKPAIDIQDADLIVLNTCSIREKAVHKVHTRLGQLREQKKKKPLIIGIIGCLAQQEQNNLFKLAPQIDFILGTKSIQSISTAIDTTIQTGKQFIDTKNHINSHLFPIDIISRNNNTAKAMITIIEGCNHNCTYCVVPTTRGSERHRPFQDILIEAQQAVDKGFKEIELLGQNVNSFNGNCSFTELINKLSDIDDLEWIRFTTSHPMNFTKELANVFINNKKVAPFLHLPVQSGSNHILRRMNRGYTVEQYLEHLKELLNRPRNLCLSTDFIVGFPGETENDFEETLNLLEIVKFDLSFSFIYSPRPNTAALKLKDDISYSIKLRRLSVLQNKQKEITLASNYKMLGQVLQARIETRSKIKGNYWLARTDNWKNVHIYTSNDQQLPFRQLVDIKITDVGPHFLKAKLI